jgi:hypothetical protein
VRGKIDLLRIDKQTGGIGHRYMTQPAIKAVIVAYPKKSDGHIDSGKPCCLYLRQNNAFAAEGLSIFKPLPALLSDGIKIGEKRKRISNQNLALEEYLVDSGFHSYGYLTPGCVIYYRDGKNWFVRNFDQSKDFKKGRLKNIAGIKRTPFVNQIKPLKILT